MANKGKGNKNPVAKETATTIGDKLYFDLAQEDMEREIDIPGEAQHKTLEEKMDEKPDLSDLQSTIRSLFPEFTEDEMNELARIVMVARIAPDVFSDLIYLNTVSLLQKSDPLKPIDVTGTLTKVYGLFSVGLDGKGRIDQIELHGSAKEEKELEKLGRSLFE